MARAGSGTYSLAAGNPVVTATSISISWANDTFTDVETAMTDSLSRGGSGGMLAPLRGVVGTVSAPAHSWTAEVTSGWYRASAGNIRFTLLGTDVLTVVAAGLSVTGTLNVSGIVETGTWQGDVVAEAYLPDAAEGAEGVVELATQDEVDTGTDPLRVVTPATLASYSGFPGSTSASTTVAGIVELAIGSEVNTGTDATRAVTPDSLNDWTGSAFITTTGTLTSLVATTADINAGTFDGVVGGTTPAAGDFSALTVTGEIVETVFAIPTNTTPELDPADGTIQTWLLSGASTPTDVLASGEFITLRIDDGSANSITWTSVLAADQWVAGSAPTLATSGYTWVELWHDGTEVKGALIGDTA
jgi:hypothetical protein